MRFPSVLLIAFAFATSAPPVWAASPASPPDTRENAPQDPQEEVRNVVKAFMLGIYEGDEKAVFDQLTFTTAESRTEAEAMIGEAVVQQELDALMTAQESKRNGADKAALDQAAQNRKNLLDSIAESIRKSDVQIMDGAAEVAIVRGPAIFLTRVDGKWKIDFEKTQRTHEGGADKNRIAVISAQVKVYKELVRDIKAGKFADKGAREINEELLKRMAQLPPPGRGAEATPADPGRKEAIADMAMIKAALTIFRDDNNRYPTTEEGLAALLKAPRGLEKTWKDQRIDLIPQDPWGKDFIYRSAGTPGGAGGYELISAGPDGTPNTADDLTQNSR